MTQFQVLNLVRKGYNKVELYSNDVLYYGVRLKFGTQRFYNMIIFGSQGFQTGDPWGYGYGLGSFFSFGKKMGMSIDLLGCDIQNDETWMDQLNIMGRLEFNFNYQITDWLSLFGGPSINGLFMDADQYSQNEYLQTLAPWVHFEHTQDERIVQGWFGLNGGIRFF